MYVSQNTSFLNYIQNKSIAIVAGAAVDKDLSNIIDNYDIVVRINTFHKILNNHYGNKTNIICFNFYPPEMKPHYNVFDKIIKERYNNGELKFIMGAHPYIGRYRYPRNQVEFEKHKKKYPNIPHLLQDPLDHIKISSKPTSGLCILVTFIQLLNRIANIGIFGMNLLLDDYNPLYNIFKVQYGGTSKFGTHNMKYERQFFKKYMQNLSDEYKQKIYIYDTKFRNFIFNNN